MLANTKEMILNAQKNNYAVPAFNVHNLENMRVCAEVAHEMRSPLILACTPSTFKFSGLENLIAIATALSNQYDIPIALHMDHHHNYQNIEMGIKNGIKSVMIDASLKSFQENVELSKKVVALARKYDATVEAELGSIPGVEDDLVVNHVLKDDPYTTPEMVLKFIKETNVDSIAVAIGNAHGIYHSKPILNINRLKEIKKKTDIPLVLHGGSGLTIEQIRQCIENGIAKVNVGTELKAPFADGIKKYFELHPEANDPRKYLPLAIANLKEIVRQRILCCKSNNRY